MHVRCLRSYQYYLAHLLSPICGTPCVLFGLPSEMQGPASAEKPVCLWDRQHQLLQISQDFQEFESYTSPDPPIFSTWTLPPTTAARAQEHRHSRAVTVLPRC